MIDGTTTINTTFLQGMIKDFQIDVTIKSQRNIEYYNKSECNINRNFIFNIFSEQ